MNKVSKHREKWVWSNMDIVDQSLDDRLTVLQTALSRTNVIPKLALDYRVDRLHLPALPVHSVQPCRRHHIGTPTTGYAHQLTATSNGRDYVHWLHSLTVEPRISQRYPLPTPTLTLPSVRPYLQASLRNPTK